MLSLLLLIQFTEFTIEKPQTQHVYAPIRIRTGGEMLPENKNDVGGLQTAMVNGKLSHLEGMENSEAQSKQDAAARKQ